MEQLTKEQLAGMFWAYAGCSVSWNNKVWNFKGFQDDTHIKLMPDSGIGYSQPFDKCKLLLIPLSEIEDEDAIEVAKLGGYTGRDYLRAGKELAETYLFSSRCNVQPINWFEILDYLRSPFRPDGTPKPVYDCGYAHIRSLIQSGHADKK